ncbi:hypothetical protein LPBF_09275 [Flavobacterium crassostreae]|uniref:Uncharacterized protein n=1 Tax=Flavobacterium crassostreae TaxID=1763534 RepID=A0A1B9DYN8_9FLAO|nr:hypothetical protein LPBF_09275 [Flavobacterium crassostreae]
MKNLKKITTSFKVFLTLAASVQNGAFKFPKILQLKFVFLGVFTFVTGVVMVAKTYFDKPFAVKLQHNSLLVSNIFFRIG